MKRKELLENNLTEEKNVRTVVESTVAADNKFLKREKRNIEDQIEDLEEQLRNRLSATTPLDKAVVENLFNGLKEAKSLLALYKEFEDNYVA